MSAKSKAGAKGRDLRRVSKQVLRRVETVRVPAEPTPAMVHWGVWALSMMVDAAEGPPDLDGAVRTMWETMIAAHEQPMFSPTSL